MLKFRKLRADEIECRVSQIVEGKKSKGIVLLLYKDARVDMRMLDEVVGQENWQRDHKELKGTMYCGVGIYSEKRGCWVWKWDCGTESYTEAQKGEASDSFKRACFNWGIGRELYTAPFIWIGEGDCKIVTGKNGKLACYDRFAVKDIQYDGDSISGLTVINSKTRKVVYKWGGTMQESGWRREPETAEKAENKPVDTLESVKHNFIQKCNLNGLKAQEILEAAGWSIDRGKATLDDYSKAEIILDERIGAMA